MKTILLSELSTPENFDKIRKVMPEDADVFQKELLIENYHAWLKKTGFDSYPLLRYFFEAGFKYGYFHSKELHS